MDHEWIAKVHLKELPDPRVDPLLVTQLPIAQMGGHAQKQHPNRRCQPPLSFPRPSTQHSPEDAITILLALPPQFPGGFARWCLYRGRSGCQVLVTDLTLRARMSNGGSPRILSSRPVGSRQPKAWLSTSSRGLPELPMGKPVRPWTRLLGCSRIPLQDCFHKTLFSSLGVKKFPEWAPRQSVGQMREGGRIGPPDQKGQPITGPPRDPSQAGGFQQFAPSNQRHGRREPESSSLSSQGPF